MERLKDVLRSLDGDKTKLIIDLSCRKQGGRWTVAMNKWQTLTDMDVNKGKYGGFMLSPDFMLICLLKDPLNSWSPSAPNS